jgi:hypothetical protein
MDAMNCRGIEPKNGLVGERVACASRAWAHSQTHMAVVAAAGVLRNESALGLCRMQERLFENHVNGTEIRRHVKLTREPVDNRFELLFAVHTNHDGRVDVRRAADCWIFARHHTESLREPARIIY